jgi:hypothetical protein
MKRQFSPSLRFALLLCAGLSVRTGWGQANPYRGLWVGSVSLRAVNEVAVPLDERNVPIAPIPQVPTPTHDEANLRILLHVNGAGQAFLLKDVAILNRVAPTPENALNLQDEADLALVTDPRVYTTFPPQPARRLAAAAFDFGDAQATRALDAVLEQAVQRAVALALPFSFPPNNQVARVLFVQSNLPTVRPLVQQVADRADVAESFRQFLSAFTSTKLDAIAGTPAAPEVTEMRVLANNLRDQSFYQDTRGVDMLAAVVAYSAANQGLSLADRKAGMYNVASGYADTQNLYQRFVSGQVFGEMIRAAAERAAQVATNATTGASAAAIEASLRALPTTTTAQTDALNAKVAQYNDTRSRSAVDQVLAAMASAAFANRTQNAKTVQSAADSAARTALVTLVARYPLPPQTPTVDYNEWVQSAAYDGTVAKVVQAALEGAAREKADNPLFNQNSVTGAARVAAANAVSTEYAQAARALRTELFLAGTFGPGSGDPRLVSAGTPHASLGPAGLTGTILLPANHPTNPFRHRRHPDHTTGFDIERRLRLDFDGATTNVLAKASFGVDQIVGTYREELFGLHKPLGPQPDTAPVGLRTEGRFELNRISRIDTLNTR